MRRLVWVQFEGYLPDNQRSYRYPVTQMIQLGGYPFIYDTVTFDMTHEVAQHPDSDLAAAQNFLQSSGYGMAREVQAQRFVYLNWPDNRNELMIIYGESSSEPGNVQAGMAKDHALASFSVQFL